MLFDILFYTSGPACIITLVTKFVMGYVAVNKVMACLIPYLKIPLIIGDFIFAVSAYFSIFIILNVHRVAVGVAVGLHRVAGVARF